MFKNMDMQYSKWGGRIICPFVTLSVLQLCTVCGILQGLICVITS